MILIIRDPPIRVSVYGPCTSFPSLVGFVTDHAHSQVRCRAGPNGRNSALCTGMLRSNLQEAPAARPRGHAYPTGVHAHLGMPWTELQPVRHGGEHHSEHDAERHSLPKK